MDKLDYKSCGVDIDKADKLVKTVIKKHVKGKGFEKGGLFSGVIDASALKAYKRPLLLSTIDGVGTKTKIASRLDLHQWVGWDIVNHCSNDLVVQGAKPLYFLDYIGTGKVEEPVFSAIISSISSACEAAGCSLVGGETAEMPDVYAAAEYDLVGTMGGVVDAEDLIDGSKISDGDVIVSLPSSGLHTNGYTLARKIVQTAGLDYGAEYEGLGCTLGEALLKPHALYSSFILSIMKKIRIKGLAHITGGGIPGNLSRVLPATADAQINTSSITPLPIFELLQKHGRVERSEMFRVFNMGAGMLCVLDRGGAAAFIDEASEVFGSSVRACGKVTQGTGKVRLEH